ncbi:hypothetical protein [Hoeflea halophila]|uniref:hypothetical protein n=1 Tax=Hoeflea halophila TaxID=714899 RepID=UPI0015C6B087|nr:hypothetical protein [Hoeflea halophila]
MGTIEFAFSMNPINPGDNPEAAIAPHFADRLTKLDWNFSGDRLLCVAAIPKRISL